ncbi:NAD(P)/FAD-dependent oxidoreductase [Mycobacterium sp. DL99]|uniref:dihydrolipoyl dehydrogenase family protein n=1 Tax=Mycobacterium sp. DL99 TaxID=2528957 RepID=UPI001080A415|nr:NAD(P)/FAD-dependent oxidoreductase [Mycobacterium sp. DL99]
MEYDVVILGAGPVGQTAAQRVRSAGLSAAVTERELVGGECSYWGCVPSKAMLRPGGAVADARRVDGARQAVVGEVDAAGVFARRNRYVTDWDDSGQAGWVKGIGADLFRGHAALSGPRRVVVRSDGAEPVTLTARHAVAICTGSVAAVPDIPGVAEAQPWTNRRATDSGAVPARLVVVGAGGVGVEMATAWQSLGSAVTLLVRGPVVLPRMEPFVGELVRDGLTESGVTVRTGVSVTGLRRPDRDGPVTIEILDKATGATESIEADETLFATGRTPNTGEIGLETVGLTPGDWLDVDATCLVSGVSDGWLYALGDVNHRALLTHQGKYQARMAAGAIAARASGTPVADGAWEKHATTADLHAVPQVFFTDPEAGSVGITAAQAENDGRSVVVVDIDMGAAVPGANFFADGYTGRARMVVETDTGAVLGVTFVGPGVAELLYSATVAVAGQVPVDRLWHAVPCFPTISEVWLKLLEEYRSLTS